MLACSIIEVERGEKIVEKTQRTLDKCSPTEDNKHVKRQRCLRQGDCLAQIQHNGWLTHNVTHTHTERTHKHTIINTNRDE